MTSLAIVVVYSDYVCTYCCRINDEHSVAATAQETMDGPTEPTVVVQSTKAGGRRLQGFVKGQLHRVKRWAKRCIGRKA